MLEYKRLKQSDLFSTIKRNIISDNTLTVLVRNFRSLSKHVDHIVNDDRKINNSIVGFTETQTNSPCKMIETFNFFYINFNNSENKL